ncbi:YdcF family protein [Companilactobacillus ginsenosidimutans]|uniref:DUF218 domain-containing protein n=1 Tax=Companilactobacillus ginsenosidimutans TaxID=1007676 RepID=A0A0H4QFP4_9LACO|nr:YdcF family protein [Companilactobacillus ginsenosidimutans]AKP67234.1 hypothetical protein ABM34_06575 [Companilactobacillus ginsenosidimutans]
MSFLAYIIFVAVLEVALVFNVRYLFSRHPAPTLIAVIIFILGLIPPIIRLQKLPHLSPLYTIFLSFIFSVDLMFLLIMGIYSFYVKHYSRDEKIDHADYIVVLGSKFMSKRIPPILMSRLEKTLEVYHSMDDKPLIIVSGGRSSISKIQESTIMREFLLEQGVPDSSIIVEGKSINTAENLEYSSILIRNHWEADSNPSIVIVTSEFHIPRAKRLTKRIGLAANFVPSITMPIFKWPAMFREFTAIIWYYRYTIETVMLMIIVLLICTFVP